MSINHFDSLEQLAAKYMIKHPNLFVSIPNQSDYLFSCAKIAYSFKCSPYDALALSIDNNQSFFFNLLLNHRIEEIDINSQDENGNTLLIYAAMYNNKNILNQLIRVKADVNIRNSDRNTALNFAALGGDIEIVEALVKAGSEINVKNKYGATALLLAKKKSHTKIVKYLIENRGNADFFEDCLLAKQKVPLEIWRIFSDEKGKLDDYHQMMIDASKQQKPNEEFKKQFNILTYEKQKVLYNIAYEWNNPFLFELSDTVIEPEKYSINFIWLQKEEQLPEQLYLFTNHEKMGFDKAFIEPISQWVKLNPNTTINIWYDEQNTSSESFEKTHNELLKKLENDGIIKNSKIQFRKIEDIHLIENYKYKFSIDFNVYFRVDLARAIILDMLIQTKEVEYAVYADLDMKPLSNRDLFDKRTVELLKEGIVMAKSLKQEYENGFQIISGMNPKFLDLHKKIIIDENLDSKAETYSESVYLTYKKLFDIIYPQDGFKPIPTKAVELPPSHFSEKCIIS